MSNLILTTLDPNSEECTFAVEMMNDWTMEIFQVWHIIMSTISFFSLIYVYLRYRKKLLLFHVNASVGL
ncbi:unnamed protein product, partial [Mesorhabditis belari]|uniref:Uncharacterized protein n=1 Tax=Mesorhabditis belari TaxID=2138241 RepID=A0AAF3F390_9BILA